MNRPDRPVVAFLHPVPLGILCRMSLTAGPNQKESGRRCPILSRLVARYLALNSLTGPTIGI